MSILLQLLQSWKTIVPLEKVSITDFFREFSFRPVETSCLRIYCTTDFNASSVSRGLDFLTTSQPGWKQSSWQDKDKTWPRKSSPISREQNITSNLLLPWGMISWDQLVHRKRKQTKRDASKNQEDKSGLQAKRRGIQRTVHLSLIPEVHWRRNHLILSFFCQISWAISGVSQITSLRRTRTHDEDAL
jgi:hypothetical protein